MKTALLVILIYSLTQTPAFCGCYVYPDNPGKEETIHCINEYQNYRPYENSSKTITCLNLPSNFPVTQCEES